MNRMNFLLISLSHSLGQTTFKVEDGCVAQSKEKAEVAFKVSSSLSSSGRYHPKMKVIERDTYEKKMHKLWDSL